MENQKNKSVVRVSELLNAAKQRSGLSKEVLLKSLRAIAASVTDNVSNGNTVVIDDFGKFDSRTIKEHSATPPNHEPVVVPEHKQVRFKAFKNFLYYHMR